MHSACPQSSNGSALHGWSQLCFRIPVELGNRFAKLNIPELEDAGLPSQRLACVHLCEGGHGAAPHDKAVTVYQHGGGHIFLPALESEPCAGGTGLPAAFPKDGSPSPCHAMDVAFPASDLLCSKVRVSWTRYKSRKHRLILLKIVQYNACELRALSRP